MFIVNRKFLVRKTFVGELYSAEEYIMEHLQDSISAVLKFAIGIDR
jgi:hypothetical protein